MRHAQKTELFTRVVAGLGHEKMGGAVVLGRTHNAQRRAHGVCLHGDCCYGIAAGTAAEAEGWPAACSAAACPHTMQVSAWWCSRDALEGDSAAPPGAWGRRSLWSHANRRVACQVAAPRLGAWNPSPAVRHARQPGWRLRIKASRQMVKLGLSDGFWRACQGSPRHWRGEAGGQGTSPCSPEARARSAGVRGWGGLTLAQPAQKPS